MNLTREIENWGDQDHPRAWGAVRVVLGIFLFIKGILFLENFSDLQTIITDHSIIHPSLSFASAIAYAVIGIHLIGGAMMALGVYTRFWAFMQMPVLFGAVFFVNVFNPQFSYELLLSVMSLTLLTIFMVVGSGSISVDQYFEEVQPQKQAA